MMQGLGSKIDKTMDKILTKRKTEFQTIQQDMENLIERRRTEFESHVEVFIENETGNREESTLHQSLTIALAEAAEQMSNTNEDAKKAVDDYIAMCESKNFAATCQTTTTTATCQTTTTAAICRTTTTDKSTTTHPCHRNPATPTIRTRITRHHGNDK
jgi:hypothetical protein